MNDKEKPKNEHIRETSIRFNLRRAEHQQAWEFLQNIDRSRFSSHSNAIIKGLLLLAESQDHDAQEQKAELVQQIVSGVYTELLNGLPAFLSGYQAAQGMPMMLRPANELPRESMNEQEADDSEAIDWDFLSGQ